MATLKDIAEKTGISVATISRVLNNNPGVSEEKRRLVLDAMSEMNYKFTGRGAKDGKGKVKQSILAVTSSFGFWGDMYDGMAAASRELGYSLLIYYQRYGKFDLTQFAEDGMLFNNNIAGIIMANKEIDGEAYTALRDRLPVVFCGQYFRPDGACSVSSDDTSAAYELTEHLLNIGRQRIALVQQRDDFEFTNFTTLQEERVFGYRRALEKHGVLFDENLIFDVKMNSPGDFNNTMHRMLAEEDKPDAVLCLSGPIAQASMKYLLRNGYRVPEDIALVGFDNDRAYSGAIPEITTIKQNYFDFGTEGVKVLHAMINGQIANGRKIYIDHELLIRGSTVPGAD